MIPWTPWTAAHQASLSFIISQFAQTHVHWVGVLAIPEYKIVLKSEKRWKYKTNVLCWFLNRIEENSIWTSSDQISRSVVSDSSRPHESQHTRPPCRATVKISLDKLLKCFWILSSFALYCFFDIHHTLFCGGIMNVYFTCLLLDSKPKKKYT